MKTESEGCSPSRSGSEVDPLLAANHGARPASPHGTRDRRARTASRMRFAGGLILVAIAAISWWLALSSCCAAGDTAACRSATGALQSLHVAQLTRLGKASAPPTGDAQTLKRD